ncbi:MAG: LCCL domain-containing protein [Gemmataceae bacterium]
MLRCIPLLLLAAPLAAQEPPGPTPKKEPAATVLELRLVDNSTLKAVLLNDKIDIATKYGRLSVPAADVQRIDFGLRLSPELLKKIDAAIADLANSSEKARETAVAALLAYRERAVPALKRASQGRNAELSAKARELLEQIQESFGDERVSAREEDVIRTDGFDVVGKIETPTLRARTSHFGELEFKITDLRAVRLPGAEPDAVAVSALPDPGSLTQYGAQIGKTFYFHVTGAPGGSLWGTDVYTTDSTLAAAAVHCGILKPGQTGVVKVTMMASPPAFQGSTRHGLTSSGYGQYPAAYKVSKP